MSYCFIYSCLFIKFWFHIRLAYLKWHYMWVYHTSVIYSWFAFRFFKVVIIWLFFFTLAIMLSAYMSKDLFLYIITPNDLYFSARSYPAICFPMLFSHSVYFILLFIISILDFFLLIFIIFCSAHVSLIFIVFSSFSIFYPIMLVSSAKIYGDIYPSFKYSSVKSLVKMLNKRQDILHPCPSPLPIGMLSYFDGMVRLLNISFTP